MGKSAAGRLLGELRVPVVDTDLLAREAVAVGSGAWSEIREAFGTEFFLVSGEIDRAALDVGSFPILNHGAVWNPYCIHGFLPHGRSVWDDGQMAVSDGGSF